MQSGKLFIGRSVRKLRADSGDTQASFAAKLGISTSYLNQLENNQRPISAAVLMLLADKFQVDLRSFGAGDDDRLLSALSETLADPLFETQRPSLQELRLVVRNAPGVARALMSVHAAYRQASEQLAGLDSRDESAGAAITATAYEEVRDFFHFVNNYLHELDASAEELARRLSIPQQEPGAALTAHLENRLKVRVLRSEESSAPLRRFDAKAKALFLNPGLPTPSRNFLLAYQISSLETAALIDRIATQAEFRSADAIEICKIGLANYFAGALLLPYGAFRAAAQELRHDLELLATRFHASLEQVAHRLSTLQRPGDKGVPVFFARIDRAGNITKRHSAAKFQFARHGGACPLWNIHQAFESPGRIIRQLAQTPDGVKYLSVATEIVKGVGGFKSDRRRYAIALGCESAYAGQFVYSDGLDLGDKTHFEPIGISCRICERPHCSHRSVPPLRHRLLVDHSVRDIVPYSVK
jgi:XRE family transcriptional regulator, fatty acid utilization regulator